MARIGMKHPVWAKLEKETNGQLPTYGEGVVIGAAVSGTVTINRNNTELYADDELKESDNGATGGTIALEVDDVADEVLATITGAARNEDNSIDLTGDPSPYGGYGYIEERSINNVKSYSAIWFFKVMLGQSSINAQTRGQNTSYATTPLDGTLSTVIPAADMKNHLWRRKTFTKLEEAFAWLDGLANITKTA